MIGPIGHASAVRPGEPATWTMTPSFGWCAVAIQTDSAEAARALAHEFRFLNRAPVGNVVGELTIGRSGAAYDLPAAGDASVRNGSLTDVLRCARHHVIRLLVQAHPGYLWLHAAAAANERGAIVLAGPPGAGKSTLVTALVANGWRYLADEATALDAERGLVYPFPTAPAFRVGPATTLEPAAVDRLPKRSVDLHAEQVCAAPVPLIGIVLPRYAPGTTARAAETGPSRAVLELLGSHISTSQPYADDLKRIGRLVEQIPVMRLAYGDRDAAARHLEHVVHSDKPTRPGASLRIVSGEAARLMTRPSWSNGDQRHGITWHGGNGE